MSFQLQSSHAVAKPILSTLNYYRSFITYIQHCNTVGKETVYTGY